MRLREALKLRGDGKLLLVNVTNGTLTLRLENNLWDALETENLNTRRRKFSLMLAEGITTFYTMGVTACLIGNLYV